MITMRLDTTGLRALIADNPEFEVELQRAVVRNITDDLLRVNISKRIDEVLNTVAVKGGSYYSPTYTLNPSFTAAVQTVIREQVQEIAVARLTTMVGDEIRTQMLKVRLELQGELKALMRTLLTPELATELVREKLLA